MTLDDRLRLLRDAIQIDVGNRGLARDPVDNLFAAFPDDLANACRSIASHPAPRVGIVTGFMIPTVDPPTGETDGPPGAVFLADAFRLLGIPSVLASDESGLVALGEGLKLRALSESIEVVYLPEAKAVSHDDHYRTYFRQQAGALTHLVAIERVGPSHTVRSLRSQPSSTLDSIGRFVCNVPRAARGRNHTMRGRDITDLTAPAHLLFEGTSDYTTIGIGDGGNEIGMGKISHSTICKNIPNGELTACRVATDHLIVAGISNWGAWALAAGVMLMKGMVEPTLFEPDRELNLLEHLVQHGPLVDGVSGKQTPTVDGLSIDEYAKPLLRIGQIVRT